MKARGAALGNGCEPRVWTVPPGVPFLPALADALIEGRLVPGFSAGEGDPLALARATIFLPTRRAARELRALFANRAAGRSAVLPTVRALGEFEEGETDWQFGGATAESLDLLPPMPAFARLLLLAPMVQQWKRFLPDHIRQKFQEEVEVPVSSADAVWLARDLARLMDEMEGEETGWDKLAGIVGDDLSGWWKVTLDFLAIVSEAWPAVLAEKGFSNPAAHRNALIRLEAERLAANPPAGPVIAAGSTGSNPAAAALLGVIARLAGGAVVLPGLDRELDARSWKILNDEMPEPAVLGHPQFGLAKILGRMRISKESVDCLVAGDPVMAVRARAVAEALRPAGTTDLWAEKRRGFREDALAEAFAAVTLLDAATERDEALAIAIALRLAVEEDGKTAALVTGDRDLARRVSAELGRFGIRADDSGGTPLSRTPPGQLLAAALQTALAPGDPIAILSLLKHPLLLLGLDRATVRRAAEAIELVAFRGGAGRPDIADLEKHFERRLAELSGETRKAFWLRRLSAARIESARDVLARLTQALGVLTGLRALSLVEFPDAVRATVLALEDLGRDADGSVDALYGSDAGRAFAAFLRELVDADGLFATEPAEWPHMVEALIAESVVRPAPASTERRVAIWGLLEARLQSVDTLVVGGLNEGTWPAKAQADRFLSRLMKSGIDLEPPERRIGLAAHDFQMAMGAPNLVLARSARAGDSPAVPSRWLQRLLTFLGETQAAAMRARGGDLLAWARFLDEGERVPFEKRPEPKPPLEARPKKFSVTEIETLRRDPYAIYAKKVLRLEPVDPLIREPGPAERGLLFHTVMQRFSAAGIDLDGADAVASLLAIGRQVFAEAALPADVEAVWWPRFEHMAEEIVLWERERAVHVAERYPEAVAQPIEVGRSGVTLSGRADRIDLLAGGMADILDFKTGTSPSKKQAHTLLSPQLALEAALLKRGAFGEVGSRDPADLLFVRLKADGSVEPESILEHNRQIRAAHELAEDAWERLEALFLHYADPHTGYKSRALPFKEGDTSGTYDHLARVLEWSAGGEAGLDGEEG